MFHDTYSWCFLYIALIFISWYLYIPFFLLFWDAPVSAFSSALLWLLEWADGESNVCCSLSSLVWQHNSDSLHFFFAACLWDTPTLPSRYRISARTRTFLHVLGRPTTTWLSLHGTSLVTLLENHMRCCFGHTHFFQSVSRWIACHVANFSRKNCQSVFCDRFF